MAKAKLKLRKVVKKVGTAARKIGKSSAAHWAPGHRAPVPVKAARVIASKTPSQGNRSRGLPSHVHVAKRPSVHAGLKGMFGSRINKGSQGGFRHGVAQSIKATRMSRQKGKGGRGLASLSKGVGAPIYARVGPGAHGVARHMKASLAIKGKGYSPIKASAYGSMKGKTASLVKISKHGGKTRFSRLGSKTI